MADNYGFGTRGNRGSYGRRHLKVVEYDFLTTLRGAGAAAIVWQTEAKARTSQQRIHTHLNITGETGLLCIGRRGEVIYGWVGDRFYAGRVNEDIITLAKFNTFYADGVMNYTPPPLAPHSHNGKVSKNRSGFDTFEEWQAEHDRLQAEGRLQSTVEETIKFQKEIDAIPVMTDDEVRYNLKMRELGIIADALTKGRPVPDSVTPAKLEEVKRYMVDRGMSIPDGII